MSLRALTSSRRLAAAAGLSVGLLTALLPLTADPAPAADPATDGIFEAPALVEAVPSKEPDDSVDDPAIWVDPANPERSVIIAADHKDKGLFVYDLSGALLQDVGLSSANNVDIRTGFPFAAGPAPIVGLAGSGDVAFFRFDPATRRLSNVTKGATQRALGQAHGTCLYHSPVSGKFYSFITDRSGVIYQYELVEDAGKVWIELVRSINIEPQGTVGGDPFDPIEGCVADEATQSLFVGEQDWNIWRYGAEPTDPTGIGDRVMIDKEVSNGGHFQRDVEGLTVVNVPGEGGYLIASSQGDYTYTVYRSAAPYDFVRKVRVVASATADGCERTDGIDAVATNLGPNFPQGIFVCQDNYNTAPVAGNMNLKFVRLESVLPLGAPPPPASSSSTTTTTQPSTASTVPSTTTTQPKTVKPAASGSGYWMLGQGGQVFAFGEAVGHGQPAIARPAKAVDLEPTPTGLGYWVIDDRGSISNHGDAITHGSLAASRLAPGELVTSLSATPNGAGYWVFTSLGRAFAFGDAKVLGDMAGAKLNAPVLDSIATPTGKGYYMVAADGGIFSFGDALFYGSTGAMHLNQPVQSLVPDPDGAGYWLVAADGGVFAFSADFRGSMGNRKLNKPVTGMVPFGNGYLMVGEDGGIFNFSDKAFSGSLGAAPPADPIISVAALG